MTRTRRLHPTLLAITVLLASSPSCTTNYPEGVDASVAFFNVNLISMTSDSVMPGQTVLVESDRIAWIGSLGREEIPEGVKVVDGTDQFLLPGLADMHVHVAEFADPVPVLDMFLANGVTTIRQCDGGTGRFILNWKHEVERKERRGPRILSTGEGFVYDQSNIADRVRLQHELGFDQVKIFWALGNDSFNALMKEAKDLNMYVVGHIPFEVGFENVLDAGMDEIAHIEEIVFSELVDYDFSRDLDGKSALEWYDIVLKLMADELLAENSDVEALLQEMRKRIPRIVQQLVKHGTIVGTTLYVDKVVHEKLHRPLEFILQPQAAYMTEEYKTKIRNGEERHQVQFKGMENELLSYKTAIDGLLLRELNKAGVRLLCGTDSHAGMGIVPGFSINDELEVLVEQGLTPYEALRTATANVSEVMDEKTGRSDFGTLEAGKRADMILLARNPLTDVGNLRYKTGVMSAGEWYSSTELAEMVRIEPDHVPRPGRTELMRTIVERGMDAAVDEYWKAKNTKSKEGRIDVEPLQMAGLAEDLSNEGRTEEALVVQQLIADEMPEKWYAQYMLGQAYAANGQSEMAEKSFRKAWELNPDSKLVQRALGQAE